MRPYYRFVSLLVVTCTLLVCAVTAQAASPKRGWAGSQFEQANAANASWLYNWWHAKPAGLSEANGEWIPLLKFINGNTPNNLYTIASYQDVDTLLVLNEPERADQSDVTVAEAIAIWPTIEQVLPNHKLVGPAVSDNAAGQQWLADFMAQANAQNLRVDAVSFHWYGASTPNNPAGAAANFLNRVDAYYNDYNLPVWITEFAIHDWGGNYSDDAIRQANAEFLDIVIPELESRSYVEKYAFYNHFSDANLFTEGPITPTVAGDAYVGSLESNESFDLNGTSQGTDVFYLRGGTLTNSGPAIPAAMRAVDAIEGVSTIDGTGDWELNDGGAFTVRQSATVRKLGSNSVTLRNAATQIDGTLEVLDGSLRVFDSPLDNATLNISESGQLALSYLAGREHFPLTNVQLQTSGTVSGPVLANGGTVITTSGSAAVLDSSVIIDDAVLNVGGDGFNESGSPPAIVTNGLALNFDAALDTPNDGEWTNATGGPGVQFSGNTAPSAVQDATFNGLTAAYDIGQSGPATGLNGYFESLSPQRSRTDGTFEVVFHVSDTAAGVDQVLFEAGATRGLSLLLSDNTLQFTVSGDDGPLTLSQNLTAGWHHVVGVVDLVGTQDDLPNDTMSLYLNDVLVGTISDVKIDDWAGGNITGLGGAASGVAGASSPANYHDRLAIARYYHDVSFTQQQVSQNYNSLVGGVPAPSVLNFSQGLTITEDAELRFDIAGGGSADKISVAQTLNVLGGTLVVTQFGDSQIMAGDHFDLFDAAAFSGQFDSIQLPELSAGLMWNASDLFVSGELSVTIAGDYNNDGQVDLADYAVWRNSLGATGDILAADGNGDQVIDVGDYQVWKGNFGQIVLSTAALSNVQVPEPSSLAILAVLGVGLIAAGRASGGQ